MERMITPTDGVTYDDETLRITAELIRRHADRLATADGRRGVLLEIIRRGVARNFGGAARSLAWRSSTALAASLPALDEADQRRILAALAKSEARFIDRMADFYRIVMSILGLREKAGVELKTVVAAVSSVIDGLIWRSMTNPVIAETALVKPDLDGEPASWGLPAVTFLAIFDSMVEPDPEFSPAGPRLDAALSEPAHVWDEGSPRHDR